MKLKDGIYEQFWELSTLEKIRGVKPKIKERARIKNGKHNGL